jgi:hypothetical protein
VCLVYCAAERFLRIALFLRKSFGAAFAEIGKRD